MDSLRKVPQVELRTFALLVFLAGYCAATITVLALYDILQQVILSVGILLVTSLLIMTLTFGYSRLLKRTDVVDAAWGVTITVIAATSLLLGQLDFRFGYTVQALATILVIVWGMRLSYYMIRRILSRPEDARYVELRRKWQGNEAINTYMRIFVVQGVLAVTVAGAVICINLSESTKIGTIAIVGAVVWLIGFLFEAIGDWQLRRFIADSKNKGKLMTSGLWGYTRHPNYFGEAVQWWGIFIIALSVPLGWMGIIAPVIITYLLLYISGVPLAEESLQKKKGWKAYSLQTNKFLPRLLR